MSAMASVETKDAETDGQRAESSEKQIHLPGHASVTSSNQQVCPGESSFHTSPTPESRRRRQSGVLSICIGILAPAGSQVILALIYCGSCEPILQKSLELRAIDDVCHSCGIIINFIHRKNSIASQTKRTIG